MALSKPPLKSAMQASLESYPDSPTKAGQDWANAIADHVSLGQSPQGVPPVPASVAAGKPGLASAIGAAFQDGSSAGAASEIAAGATVFYQALLFAGATPGVVSAVTGTSALSSALASAFDENTENSASMAEAAERFADAIHACAQTVIVTHAPPSAVTGPLT